MSLPRRQWREMGWSIQHWKQQKGESLWAILEGWRRPAGLHFQARQRTHPALYPVTVHETHAYSPQTDLYPAFATVRKGALAPNIFEILCEFQVKNCSAFKAKWKFGRSMCFPLRFKREINIPPFLCAFVFYFFKWKEKLWWGSIL